MFLLGNAPRNLVENSLLFIYILHYSKKSLGFGVWGLRFLGLGEGKNEERATTAGDYEEDDYLALHCTLVTIIFSVQASILCPNTFPAF
jgi:hypothetical protein